VTTIENLPPTAGVERDGDHYFAADGARLRYRDEGGGPPVIMVHGWTLDLQMWEPQVDGLRDAFRVVRFDRRGFGLSSGRPSAVQDIADIGSLCEHLSIGRVALVGMSQGVRAVMGFALSAPERISCLILDGPPDPGQKPSPADGDVPLSRYRAIVRERGIAAFRREWAAHPLLSLRTGDPRMREILSTMIARYPANDLLEPVATAAVPASPSPIGSIDVPVLVITGDHDLASRTLAAEAIAERSANTERAVIQAAGHLPNLDNPKAYNAVVRTFLERHAVPFR
jgi:pimeloyl-ACP methyl ester carboxylesterase